MYFELLSLKMSQWPSHQCPLVFLTETVLGWVDLHSDQHHIALWFSTWLQSRITWSALNNPDARSYLQRL